MRELPFHKGQALGNDYLVIDVDALPWPLSPRRAAALCDRHRGAGADGILLVTLGDPVLVRIHNPDGSEAEKSGNGLRILAAYLHARGLVGEAPFRVRLPGESVRMRVLGARADGGVDVVVDMGTATFGPDAVAYRGAALNDQGLALPDREPVAATLVSVGNPHCVVFATSWTREAFLETAPRIAHDPGFARGVNVQFARVADAAALDVWIWERGVGETAASGSSATAAAAAAVRRGLLEPGALEVRMPGGAVRVDVGADGTLQLSGPASITFAGRVAAPIVEAWGEL